MKILEIVFKANAKQFKKELAAALPVISSAKTTIRKKKIPAGPCFFAAPGHRIVRKAMWAQAQKVELILLGQMCGVAPGQVKCIIEEEIERARSLPHETYAEAFFQTRKRLLPTEGNDALESAGRISPDKSSKIYRVGDLG